MSDRFLTSHVGSLPRPEDLVEANRARMMGGGPDDAAFAQQLAGAVGEVVARQREVGIDVVNDGEFGHSMGQRYDYGAWFSYVFGRLGGLEMVNASFATLPAARPKGDLRLGSWGERRDWQQFAEAYSDPSSGAAHGDLTAALMFPVARGPVTYTGQAMIQRDIANLKAALEANGLEDGYLNSVAPGSGANFGNEYYDDDEALLYACADAMREEYTAIIDAGLMLQLDDPSMADSWDQVIPEPSVEAYQRYTRVRVEALNHAIRGLPPERIRFHLCWGSWHGPHVTDIPLVDLIELMLEINAGGYSFEAANARHEHEWSVWENVRLPEGKKILPGVVTHSTNVVEHPELVAERILRFASVVGAENVIASTDCGVGGRVHPQIAWAKLDALARGAELASAKLGSRTVT